MIRNELVVMELLQSQVLISIFVVFAFPGMNHLSGPVSKLSRGLVCLNLASTGMTAKGVNKLAEALCSNRFIPTSLHVLNLSGNMLKGEEITVSIA